MGTQGGPPPVKVPVKNTRGEDRDWSECILSHWNGEVHTVIHQEIATGRILHMEMLHGAPRWRCGQDLPSSQRETFLVGNVNGGDSIVLEERDGQQPDTDGARAWANLMRTTPEG